MKLFLHKWYVFGVTIYNIVKAIYKATDKVASVRVEIITEKDLDNLQKAIDERMQVVEEERAKNSVNVQPDVAPSKKSQLN